MMKRYVVYAEKMKIPVHGKPVDRDDIRKRYYGKEEKKPVLVGIEKEKEGAVSLFKKFIPTGRIITTRKGDYWDVVCALVVSEEYDLKNPLELPEPREDNIIAFKALEYDPDTDTRYLIVPDENNTCWIRFLENTAVKYFTFEEFFNCAGGENLCRLFNQDREAVRNRLLPLYDFWHLSANEVISLAGGRQIVSQRYGYAVRAIARWITANEMPWDVRERIGESLGIPGYWFGDAYEFIKNRKEGSK